MDQKGRNVIDVAVGEFDGAEVCEAVANFLLYQLSKNYNKKDIDLYRDNGLAIFKTLVAPKQKKLKKLQKLFKDNHLNITIQCNLKIVSYLDVTFNLTNATYQPFCRSNNEITYIHKESNHPPSVLWQIKLSVKSRLSKHSSNKKIFKKSTQIYQEPLKQIGHHHQLTYRKSRNNKKKDTNRRKRQNNLVQSPIQKKCFSRSWRLIHKANS